MLCLPRILLKGRDRVARGADPRPRGPRHARSGEPCIRRAFTLLEVILAIAILAGALAALGEVVRLSGENANAARDLSQAQLLAASKMAEIAAGAVELTSVPPSPIDTDADPPWIYEVELTNSMVDGLVAVHVTVEQDRPEAEQPIRVTFVRWMPDPAALPASTNTGSSSSGSGSSASESGGR